MECPECAEDTWVTDSRILGIPVNKLRPLIGDEGMIRRRRVCKGCGNKFTTLEMSTAEYRHKTQAEPAKLAWIEHHAAKIIELLNKEKENEDGT